MSTSRLPPYAARPACPKTPREMRLDGGRNSSAVPRMDEPTVDKRLHCGLRACPRRIATQTLSSPSDEQRRGEGIPLRPRSPMSAPKDELPESDPSGSPDERLVELLAVGENYEQI